MDFSPEQFGIQTGTSLALWGAYRSYKWFKKRRIVKGIVIPTGKSTLCDRLSGDCKNYFVDIDSYAALIDPENFQKLKDNASQYMLFFFPKLDAYVNQLFKSFSNKVIILVSSRKDMLEQLGVKKVRVFCPSSRLIDNLRIEQAEKASLKCVNMLLASQAEKFKVFDDFNELYKLVRDKFDVRNVLNV